MNRLILSIVMLLLLSDSARAEDPVTLFGPTMGTAWSVKLSGVPEGFDSAELKREIAAYLEAFDAFVSTYRADSELARFNASRSVDWFPVSTETAELLRRTLELAEQTSGAFDPTVAPLTRLWKFDDHSGRQDLPTEQEVDAARELVGYQRLQVRLDPPAIRKEIPALELNLNAVAPGWAVDRIVDQLRARGLTNFLVDVGSEIRTGGRKADGSAWQVGIERPADQGHVLQASLPLNDRAIATSGDYRNYYVVAGQRYSHTIDPRTGRPVNHGLASVTVVATDCTTADALATAISVLGPQAGRAWADEHQLPAWMMVRDASGGLTAQPSAEFDAVFSSQMTDIAGDLRPATVSGIAEETPSSAKPAAGDSKEHGPSASAGTSPWLLMLLALAAFVLAAGGLALGLMLRGKPLAGSCGGLAGMKDEHGHSMCGSCSIPPEQCDEFRKSLRPAAVDGRESAKDQA